jgi:hypothetical protein
MLRNILGLSVHQMSRTGGAVFAYLFGRFDQKKLVKILAEEEDPELSARILNAIRTDGYLLLNCKLYAWAFWKSRSGGPKPRAEAFGIARADVPFLSRLNLAHVPEVFPSHSLAEFRALVEDATAGPEIRTYMGKFISKNMTFLIRSYGHQREALVAEMQAHAVRALYLKYPRFESELHLRNNVKTTIHNRGETIITAETSPSRNKLQQDKQTGKFVSRHVDTEVLVDLEAPDEYMSEQKDLLESLVQIAQSHNLRDDVQRFLLCCAGHYDEEFSSFLMVNNTEAVETMAYDRYLSRARKFFNFTDKQVDHLFGKLRTLLT